MTRRLKILAVCLLLFNSIAAIFGGGNLIDSPDGSNLGLTLDWLKHAPFHNYLIPGIVLLVANGFFGLFVLALIFIDFKKYSWFIVAQGVVLTGWIVIQVMMVRTVVGLHVVMGLIGVLLMLIGWRLTKNDAGNVAQFEDFSNNLNYE